MEIYSSHGSSEHFYLKEIFTITEIYSTSLMCASLSQSSSEMVVMFWFEVYNTVFKAHTPATFLVKILQLKQPKYLSDSTYLGLKETKILISSL